MPIANFLVNESASELYDLLLVRWQDYFIKSAPITIIAGQNTYTLPTDFYKSRSAAFVVGNTRTPLRQFSEDERTQLINQTSGSPDAYKIEDGNIVLLPTPSSGSVELRYVYQYPWLTLDTDTLSLNVVSGWEAYIIYDAAMKMRIKAKKDPAAIQALQAVRDNLRERIKMAAAERDASGVTRVRDTYGLSVLRGRGRRGA